MGVPTMQRGIMLMILFFAALFVALVLTGCEYETIVYDGQEMRVTEAAERIADKLEVENPDLDIEIVIRTELDN